MAGSLELLTVESELLRGNPLGDSAVRGLYIYLPPGYSDDADSRYPSIYLLQGFAGQIEDWLLPDADGETLIESVDELISSGRCRPTLLAFIDAATSRDPSQEEQAARPAHYCVGASKTALAHDGFADGKGQRGTSAEGKSMSGLWIVIVKTGPFLKGVSRLLNDEEIRKLEAFIACNPEAGTVIPGTGGVRKYRIAADGKGKRGGGRLIYYYYDDTMPVYFLTIFAKNRKADLTAEEKAVMKAFVKELVKEHKSKRKQLAG